jgi:hypothetical protein
MKKTTDFYLQISGLYEWKSRQPGYCADLFPVCGKWFFGLELVEPF